MIAWLRQPHVKRQFTIAFKGISVIGTLVTIWWFVCNLNVHQLGAAVGHATAGPLVVAVLLGLVSQANRALGWTVMLGPTYPVPYRRQVRYELIAQAASVLMPARAGELLRVWLPRAEDVPAATTLALIAVKKLFEGLGLAALSLLAFLLLTGLPRWLTDSIWAFAAAMAALVVGLVAGSHDPDPVRASRLAVGAFRRRSRIRARRPAPGDRPGSGHGRRTARLRGRCGEPARVGHPLSAGCRRGDPVHGGTRRTCSPPARRTSARSR